MILPLVDTTYRYDDNLDVVFSKKNKLLQRKKDVFGNYFTCIYIDKRQYRIFHKNIFRNGDTFDYTTLNG